MQSFLLRSSHNSTHAPSNMMFIELNGRLVEIQGVLFDLDGTSFDSWPDIKQSLMVMERKYTNSTNKHINARHKISEGTEAMLQVTLGRPDISPALIEEIQQIYINIPLKDRKSCLFDGMEQLIAYLNAHHIPWGIVTNKPKVMTEDILKHVSKLRPPSGCVICPEDVCGKKKPSPDPIQKACKILKIMPTKCMYVGDSKDDITAGRHANLITVGALYGYIPQNQIPRIEWRADLYIEKPMDLCDMLILSKKITADDSKESDKHHQTSLLALKAKL